MNKKIKNIISVLLILNLNISYIYAETNKNLQQQQEEQQQEKISTIKKNKVKTNFTNNLVCSSNYSPICWIKNWIQNTYNNSCLLEKDNAKYKYPWVCWSKIISTPLNTIWKIRSTGYINIRKNINKKPQLNIKLKRKVNRILVKLKRKLNRLTKYQRNKTVNHLINRLNAIKQKKPILYNLIDYINFKLREYIK